MDVGCVRENSGGVVVGSVEEMASAAVELLNDPQRRERLARDGRATAAERHNWDRIAETYEKQCFLVTQQRAAKKALAPDTHMFAGLGLGRPKRQPVLLLRLRGALATNSSSTPLGAPWRCETMSRSGWTLLPASVATATAAPTSSKLQCTR